MSSNKFDAILAQARSNAANIQKVATKLKIDLASKFPGEVKALNDCLDTYSATKVLIATTVADARGELTLNSAAKLSTNFDKNWDKFAAEYNSIFSHSSTAAQTNVLETFARTHFGDKIFEAGGIIKNETPSILNGIVGFKSGIDSFGGSYRNPEEAARKIKNGVEKIVYSTAQVANSANNVLKFAQGLKGSNPQGSVVLAKIGQLPQMKPIAVSMAALGIGSAGISMAGSAKGALDSIKKGDFSGAAQQGKSVVSQAKAIKNEIDRLRGVASSKTPNLSAGGVTQPRTNVNSRANAGKSGANDAGKKKSNDSDDSGKPDSYVCSTAKIKCTNGDKISTLTVLPDRTIWLTGEPQANISDHKSMVNIAPFGRCHTTAYPPTGAATAAAHGKLTPMPCVPNTPFPWMNGKDDVILKGEPALLNTSKCKCIYGGTITITFDGQKEGTGIDIYKEVRQPYEELEADADSTLSPDELLDGLQMVLDAAGFFPGLGAIPDLLNACISACRGDWTNAGLCLFAAVPGIGDAVGATKLMKNGAKVAKTLKKAQKGTPDELAALRAKKQTKAHKEKLIEQGVVKGEVVRFEEKQDLVIKKEATTGGTIEINQPRSISRTESISASSVNPYEKVTPITPSKSIGSSTSYGAGNNGSYLGKSGRKGSPKEEPLFEIKEPSQDEKIVKLDDVRMPERTNEINEKIMRGKNRPKFGL